MFLPGEGIALKHRPAAHASEIKDFDGVALHEKRLRGEICFDEQEWTARPKDAVVKKCFADTYNARLDNISHVFLPVWHILMSQADKTGRRIVLINAIEGNPMQW